jgi:esterase/lipase
MPKFYQSGNKKKRCILLIGGYKDIPYVWNEFEKYLIDNNLDYYAPRTMGNGRTFYQSVKYKDWIITYLEAIYILQDMYETIDIIGFSTGALIALYLTQFKYQCEINNLFLCAPFLLHNNNFTIRLIFGDNIFSKIINKLYTYTFRFHPKLLEKNNAYRDTYHKHYSINDYCETFGDLKMETELFEFNKFKPTKILVNNIVILNSADDNIIGNINEQHIILTKIFKKNIDLITIPTYANINLNKDKCGHVMFKEIPPIIKDIFTNIKKYL